MGLAGLRQGSAHLKPSESAGNKKFIPFINWKDGQSRTVAFLTPIEEVAKVRMHPFVKVPADNDKGFTAKQFMCRKDPAWLAESGGECYICDHIGAKVQEQYTAIAVELDPILGPTPMPTGFNVVTKVFTREDGTEVVYPQWGLVRQSFGNYFNYFTAFGQKWGGINHVAFDIARAGNDKHTAYVMTPFLGVELPSFDNFDPPIPSLIDILTELGSKERYDTLLQGAETIDQSSDFSDDNQTFQLHENTNAGFKTKFEELKESLPSGLQDKVESFGGAG